jgi:simple sugar transport system permease protein
MQAATQIPIDLVVVVTAFVILFIAAPALVRGIYRIRAPRLETAEVYTRGWGS